MNRLIWISLGVGTAALLLSIVMILVAVPLLGDTFQKTMFVNSVIGCYGIGSSVTYYCLRQAEKLKLANLELHRVREELEAATADLTERVRNDKMTGMLTREYFMEAFALRRQANPVNTLLIIDADHFKAINDRYGHLTGDRALEVISAAIKGALRQHDLVGRIGGEEFGVLLPGTGEAEGNMVAERIRASVAAIRFEPRQDGASVPLSVSIGGIISGRNVGQSQLLAMADRNLYAAKEAGRDRVVLSHGMQKAA